MRDRMPCELNKCCCCIQLRVGCLILGYLLLVANVILIIASIYEIVIAARNNISSILVIYILYLIIYLGNITFVALFLVGIHRHIPRYVKVFLIFYVGILLIYAVTAIYEIITTPTTLATILLPIITIVLDIYFLLVFISFYMKMTDLAKMPTPVVYHIEK